MICCFFSSFKTFAMLREDTYPPAAVNVLDVSSESMAAFQVFLYGRFWVFTEVVTAHMLRHTVATTLLFNGCPIGHIKDILGHDRLITTCNFYLGADKRAAKKAHGDFLDY